MKKVKKCYYCENKPREPRNIYCTDCRLKMAKGEISSNYFKVYICVSCGEDIEDSDPLSRIICRKCISTI